MRSPSQIPDEDSGSSEVEVEVEVGVGVGVGVGCEIDSVVVGFLAVGLVGLVVVFD